MKKIVLLLLIVLTVVSLLIFKFTQTAKIPFSIMSPLGNNPSLTIIIKPSISPEIPNPKKSIFVPYWGLGEEKIDTQYDEYIYFGISVREDGVVKNDVGYKKIGQFIKSIDSQKEKFLALAMTDSRVNSRVLEDLELQKSIINDSIIIAKENSFDGIVLDFELTSLSFESVTSKINGFYKLFYDSAKQNNLSFKITLYGDVFFRLRPYDVSFLGQHADQVLIMAYDFHKARGNPGPNFPLKGERIYGYDLEKMIDDFSKVVPKEQLVVVFGLFGYDWTVDLQNKSKEIATPLSLSKINSMFLANCKFKECRIIKDKESSETQITYLDKDSLPHVVWFEDLKSVEKKKEFLRSKGVYSTALWAYSYF